MGALRGALHARVITWGVTYAPKGGGARGALRMPWEVLRLPWGPEGGGVACPLSHRFGRGVFLLNVARAAFGRVLYAVRLPYGC